MTVGEWIGARGVGAPAHLVSEMHRALGQAVDEPDAAAREVMVNAADGLVSDLLDQGRTGRDSALSLLAADALVTLALEAAADEPASLVARADGAMRSLAALR